MDAGLIPGISYNGLCCRKRYIGFLLRIYLASAGLQIKRQKEGFIPPFLVLTVVVYVLVPVGAVTGLDTFRVFSG